MGVYDLHPDIGLPEESGNGGSELPCGYQPANCLMQAMEQ
jgi:hypothetical protein